MFRIGFYREGEVDEGLNLLFNSYIYGLNRMACQIARVGRAGYNLFIRSSPKGIFWRIMFNASSVFSKIAKILSAPISFCRKLFWVFREAGQF